MESPGVSGQLDMDEPAGERQSGSPMGQIQFAWFLSILAIKTIKFNLHWVWLAVFGLHSPHHSLFSVTQVDFSCLVPAASEIESLVK